MAWGDDIMRKKLSTIKGFENCCKYYIYNDGRVYSEYSNRFLKLSVDSKGYQYLNLSGKRARINCPKIHRLVMLAFSKDEVKEQINHKDGNKQNNHIDNLEYVTNRENRIHAIETKLKDEVMYGIAQYDLDNNFLKYFDTCSEALAHLGKNPQNSGNIGRCIRGKRRAAYGYIWKQYKGSTTIESTS